MLSFGSKRKLPPLIFDLESSPMIDLMCSKSNYAVIHYSLHYIINYIIYFILR